MGWRLRDKLNLFFFFRATSRTRCSALATAPTCAASAPARRTSSASDASATPRTWTSGAIWWVLLITAITIRLEEFPSQRMSTNSNENRCTSNVHQIMHVTLHYRQQEERYTFYSLCKFSSAILMSAVHSGHIVLLLRILWSTLGYMWWRASVCPVIRCRALVKMIKALVACRIKRRFPYLQHYIIICCL